MNPFADVRAGLAAARRLAGAALAAVVAALVAVGACAGPGPDVPVPGAGGAVKSAALVRAERRAYDGAPPVIAHEDLGIDCGECHNAGGLEVDGLGFAPPSPHELTAGMSAIARCGQCHVYGVTDALFAANDFAGLRQDLRRGRRLNPLAPPTIPHKTFMRENCAACHAGPAAREEVRTDHPERARCRQCHVPVTTSAAFEATPLELAASTPALAPGTGEGP